MKEDQSIAAACRAVLLAAEPYAKVRTARAVARAWRRGQLAHRFDEAMPERPARPQRPELLPANRMPKRGRGGSERGPGGKSARSGGPDGGPGGKSARGGGSGGGPG